MFKAIKARRAARVARAHMEIARIECLMEENQRRIDEIERRRNAPCSGCVAAGYVDESGRPILADAATT